MGRIDGNAARKFKMDEDEFGTDSDVQSPPSGTDTSSDEEYTLGPYRSELQSLRRMSSSRQLSQSEMSVMDMLETRVGGWGADSAFEESDFEAAADFSTTHTKPIPPKEVDITEEPPLTDVSEEELKKYTHIGSKNVQVNDKRYGIAAFVRLGSVKCTAKVNCSQR